MNRRELLQSLLVLCATRLLGIGKDSEPEQESEKEPPKFYFVWKASENEPPTMPGGLWYLHKRGGERVQICVCLAPTSGDYRKFRERFPRAGELEALAFAGGDIAVILSHDRWLDGDAQINRLLVDGIEEYADKFVEDWRPGKRQVVYIKNDSLFTREMEKIYQLLSWRYSVGRGSDG